MFRGGPQFQGYSKRAKSTLFVYPLLPIIKRTIKMLIFACMHAYAINQECMYKHHWEVPLVLNTFRKYLCWVAGIG